MVEITQSHLQTVTILTFIILGVLFILPFFSTILAAAVVAYIALPLFKYLSKKMHKTLAALSVCAGIILLLAVIVNYGVNFLLNEIGSIFFLIAHYQKDAIIDPTIGTILRNISTNSLNYISNQISQIPNLIISLFLFFIALFYFLKDGKKIFNKAWKIIPFQESKRKILLEEVKANVDAFVFATLAIGLIQGLIAGVGFLALGLSYPIIVAFTAAILSIIPILGPYILYIGVGAFLFFQGSVGIAVAITAYGLVSGSILDYVARPYLISRRATSHPLIVFLGIFGGIHILGILGVIIGPIVLSVSIAFIKDIRLYGIEQ